VRVGIEVLEAVFDGLEYVASDRVRIGLAVSDGLGEAVDPAGSGEFLLEHRVDILAQQSANLLGVAGAYLVGVLAGVDEVVPVGCEFVDELVDAGAVDGDGLDDRRRPALVGLVVLVRLPVPVVVGVDDFLAVMATATGGSLPSPRWIISRSS